MLLFREVHYQRIIRPNARSAKNWKSNPKSKLVLETQSKVHNDVSGPRNGKCCGFILQICVNNPSNQVNI